MLMCLFGWMFNVVQYRFYVITVFVKRRKLMRLNNTLMANALKFKPIKGISGMLDRGSGGA